MLASIFIYGGIDSLRHTQAHAEAAKPVLDYAAPLLDKAVEVTPVERRPADVTLVRIDGLVKIAAGALLALGKAPRVASAVLAGSLIPTTFASHRFWEETGPDARKTQQVEFLKNAALLGGLMIAAADTHGKPSQAWRGRNAAKAASVAVGKRAAAAKAAAHDTSEKVSEAAAGLAGLGSGAAAAGPVKYADAAPAAKVRVAELGEALSEKAARTSDIAARAADVVAQRAADVAAATSERAGELGAVAADKAAVLGGELGGLSSRARKKADKRRAALQKTIDQKAAGWEKRARKAAQKAKSDAKKVRSDAPHYAEELATAVEGIARDARRRAKAAA